MNSGRRLVSFILVLTLLFSSMTVLSYAFDEISIASNEGEVEGNTASKSESSTTPGAGTNVLIPPEDGVTILYNRNFDDGYDFGEGLTLSPKEHKFELAEDESGNKYFKMTAQTIVKEKDGYFDFSFAKTENPLDTLVVKMDVIFDSIKTDDSGEGLFPGNFIRFRDVGKGTVLRGLAMTSAGYVFLNETGYKVTKSYDGNTKHTFAFVVTTVETDDAEKPYSKTLTIYMDNTAVASHTIKSANPFMDPIRVGFFGDQPAGTEVGIDNLQMYYCDPEKIDTPFDVDLGRSYGSNSEKVPYEEELFMKIGADSALLKTKKLKNVYEPVSIDGKAYLPVDTLAKYLGYDVSTSDTAVTLTKTGAAGVVLNVGSDVQMVSVNESTGYAVIYYGDVAKHFSGYYGSYNDMGLIVVSPVEGYAQIATDLALVDIMKRFIFDSIDENKEKVNVVDKATFQANTAQHPYLLANQSEFDYYKSIYDQGAKNNEDPVLYSYINTLVKSAKNAYDDYADTKDGAYAGLKVVPVMPYNDNINNGYDGNGGRQNDTDTYGERMKTLAFGYQITRESKYALMAYDYAIALGAFEHWGPAHFLNCADTAGPFAIAYDWLYNAWAELGLDVDKVTEILFIHGVLAGWYSVNKIPLPWGRRTNYKSETILNGGTFATMENNWNAVCTAGMTAAALAIAGDVSALKAVDKSIEVKNARLVENTGSNKNRYPYIFAYDIVPFSSLGDHSAYTTYSDYAYNLYCNIQYTLPLNGLDFYAPDGSYVESPSYWAYSANNLFAVGTYNESVFGDEFGLITNCWGLDKTCYYALNAQSSDYSMWNYSDSGGALVPGAISTTSFPYVAYQLGDSKLSAIRKDMIDSGKYSAGYLDVFYYTKDVGELELPELQYYMKGIDGYVVRDSWEPGSTYAAIMGGYNESAHGQVDAGQFIYHNNGKIWFCDIGAEGYNVYNFGNAIYGNQYYKKSAEGNNTLALSSHPYSDGGQNSCFAGQYIYGTGYMYKTGDNDFGAYALIDQTEVYYNNADSAKRGMLFTNDRKTVVIQDEVKFFEPETVHWIGHTYQQVYVTTGGRTAYMTDGVSTIRVTLISDNTDLKFDVLTTYEFLLEDTHTPDYALEHGTGYPEGDRSEFKRLVVTCENVTELNMAVVIEDVTGDDSIEVGYSFVPMDTWVPDEDGRQSGEIDVTVDFDESYYGYKFKGNLNAYNTYFVNSNMFTVSGDGTAKAGNYVALNLPKAAFVSAALAGDYVVLDADVFTDKDTSGLNLALLGRGNAIASAPLTKLVTTGGDWAHVTVIADAEHAYFFKNDKLVSTVALGSVSFEELQLAVVADAGATGTVSLDNVRARRIDSDDISLSTYVSKKSIANWSDKISVARAKTTVFSFDRVTSLGTDPVGGSSDVVDFGDSPMFGWGFDSTYERVSGYTFSAFEQADYSGCIVYFYESNDHAPINIDKPCDIRHGNNDISVHSDNLSAFLSTGTTEFKDEEITVYWHTGDAVETSTIKGMVCAEYSGTSENVGKITESTDENGRIVFSTTAWSLTEGGKLASDEDMIVTSKNNHFYLVEDAIESAAYFYEDADGNIVACEDPSGFLAATLEGYKRVVLNCDIEVADSGNELKKTAKVYLNGHTLSYNGTSSHMYSIKGGNLTVYGGGGSIIKSGAGNIVFTGTGSDTNGYDTIVYFENVTLETDRTLLDHRVGHVMFKNVVINQTGREATTFVIQNRTNSHTEEVKIPKLTLDGCTINHYGSTDTTFAIAVSKNARVVITNGTHINVPNGLAFKLYNSYTSGGADANYIDYSKMSVTVDETYFNVDRLYIVEVVTASTVNGSVAYSPDTAVYSNRLYDGSYVDAIDEDRYEHVLNMAGKLSLANGVGSSTNEIPELNIAEGCVFARQNDASAPYVSTSDYATVTWVAGDKAFTEYWKNGSIPTADNAEVRANLNALNANVEAGKKYSYSVAEVNGLTEIVATKFTAFAINLSLTLESSMKINVFVEKRDDVNVNKFVLDGDEVTYTDITIGGKDYYRVTIPNVHPTNAAKKHTLSVYVTDDKINEPTPVTIYFSVLDYAEAILSNAKTYGREARDLMANILHYIAAAYEYAGLSGTEDYKTVRTMLNKHINKVTYSVVEKTEAPDLSSVTDALTTVQLQLSDSPKYIFNLKDGYTGDVTLHYTTYGVEYSKTFKIDDGKYEGKSYIELALNAYDLRTGVRIVTAGGEGVYTLRDYYNATEGIRGSLTALLNALYAYSEKAEEYKNRNK